MHELNSCSGGCVSRKTGSWQAGQQRSLHAVYPLSAIRDPQSEIALTSLTEM
jgi:hypothetical protein